MKCLSLAYSPRSLIFSSSSLYAPLVADSGLPFLGQRKLRNGDLDRAREDLDRLPPLRSLAVLLRREATESKQHKTQVKELNYETNGACHKINLMNGERKLKKK